MSSVNCYYSILLLSSIVKCHSSHKNKQSRFLPNFLSKIVSWRVICTSTSTTIPTAVAADGVSVVVVVNVATAACRPRHLLSPAPRRTCPPVS